MITVFKGSSELSCTQVKVTVFSKTFAVKSSTGKHSNNLIIISPKSTIPTSEDDISIDSMVQEQESDGKATIIFLTHKSREGDIEKAIGQIEQMPFVHSKVTRIRLEQLEK